MPKRRGLRVVRGGAVAVARTWGYFYATRGDNTSPILASALDRCNDPRRQASGRGTMGRQQRQFVAIAVIAMVLIAVYVAVQRGIPWPSMVQIIGGARWFPW